MVHNLIITVLFWPLTRATIFAQLTWFSNITQHLESDWYSWCCCCAIILVCMYVCVSVCGNMKKEKKLNGDENYSCFPQRNIKMLKFYIFPFFYIWRSVYSPYFEVFATALIMQTAIIFLYKITTRFRCARLDPTWRFIFHRIARRLSVLTFGLHSIRSRISLNIYIDK